MVCECGHIKSDHEYGRDYGVHGWFCRHRSEKGSPDCGCEFYRKKIKEVLKN